MKSKRRASIYQAVRKKCTDCTGGSRIEITLCTVVDCTLWGFRFGCHPETAAHKHAHLLNAELIQRVVPRADAIVDSNSAADIIEHLKQEHQEAKKSPPSDPVTTPASTQKEANGVL